jgi:hypothetical protein
MILKVRFEMIITRMQRVLFLSVLLSAQVVTVAHAQQWPFELWHDGKIVLESGDTLRGQIKYDLQQDLVQFNIPNKVAEAYSARKVLFFEIFDNTVRRYRQFFSLPYATNTDYKAPIFFELIEEGNLTLLAREALEYRTYSNPYFIGSYSRLVLVNKYFFLNTRGDIESFSGQKNELLQRMGNQSDKVEKFIRTNRLRVDEKYDLARIIAYYNSL